MLRATELAASLDRAPGLAPRAARAGRRLVVARLDDERLGRRGPARLARGVATAGSCAARARIARPGVVEVDGQEIPYDKLVVATGSRPVIPPVEGSRMSTTGRTSRRRRRTRCPQSLVVLGGGPVGGELAQFFRALGSHVTIVERGERCSAACTRTPARCSPTSSARRGSRCASASAVEKVEPGIRVHLSDGRRSRPSGCSSRPGGGRTSRGSASSSSGVEITPRGIEVDERLRAAERRVGDRRRERHRAVHARRQVPGARRGGRHVPAAHAKADYRAIPAGDLHRPRGRDGREDGRRGLVSCALDARLRPRLVDVREAEARRLRPRLRGPGEARARRRRRRRAAGGRVARPADARVRAETPIDDAPRHDPAVPDVLRGDLLRVAASSTRRCSS